MSTSTSSVLRAAVGTLLTNAVAVAVAFGAPLTSSQQDVLLAFAGSVTTLVFLIFSLVHVHATSKAVALATASPQTASRPASSALGGGA